MTRIALALARPQPMAFTVSSRSLRVVTAAAAAAALAALAYAGVTRTTLFAVQRIDVSGAPPDVAREVRAALAPFAGTSLVRLDENEVVGRVKALPSVRAVEYDRAFPSTLRLVVHAERPVAVVRAGEGSWLVAEGGRVIRAVDTETARRIPRIRSRSAAGLQPGETVADPEIRVALEALASIPAEFPARVVGARAEEGAPVVIVGGRGEIRLGSTESITLKLAVAARVLAALPANERAQFAYLDVSVPARVVAAMNSQVES